MEKYIPVGGQEVAMHNMDIMINACSAEEPIMQLDGLSLWINGWEFPEAEKELQEYNYYDANFLIITARFQSEGSEVWTYGPILQASMLKSFLEEIERMYASLTGSAVFASLEPGLEVHLTANKFGKIHMTLDITPEHNREQHKYIREIDQSYLKSLILDLRKAMLKFPIRDKNL